MAKRHLIMLLASSIFETNGSQNIFQMDYTK